MSRRVVADYAGLAPPALKRHGETTSRDVEVV